MRWLVRVGALAAAVALFACGDAADSTAGCTPVPAGTSSIRVEPDWQAGDTVSLGIEQTRAISGVRPSAADWEAVVSVVEVRDDGYVMRWDSDEHVIDPGGLRRAGVPIEAIDRLDALQGLHIDYLVDGAGGFVGVVDLDDLAADFAEALIVMRDAQFPDDGSEEAAQRIRIIEDLAADPVAIENTVTERLQAYHSLYGAELDANSPTTWVVAMPNLLGGEPFQAIETRTVESRQNGDGCVVIAATIEPDTQAVAEAMVEISGGVGDTGGTTAEELASGLTIRTDAAYRWDAGSGWIRKLEVRQTIELAGGSRVDTLTIVAN